MRQYITLKDKYTLLKIKPFYNLLKDKYASIQPLKISLINLKLHETYLVSAFQSGFYVTPERRSIFQFLIDYKSVTVTLLEFRSKKIAYKRSFSIKKIYSVPQIHQYLNIFYSTAERVQKEHIYETWNREIITFDPHTGVFNNNLGEECFMIRCHFDIFRSLDFKTFLLCEGNTLTVFLIKKCV